MRIKDKITEKMNLIILITLQAKHVNQ